MNHRNPGSIREGVVLGIMMHLLGQSVLVVFFTALLGRVEPALLLAATLIGATQLPYMAPALVDAAALKGRRRTARGIGTVVLATVCLNLLFIRALGAGLF